MVRDSGVILDEFLRRLSKQKTKLPHELVVLYYGTGKETLNRIKPFASKIVKIPPEQFDMGKSRDLVCKNTSGKYIVTVSVDALAVNSNWLQELISPMVSGKADIVQGEIICPNNGDPYYPNFFYWENNYGFYYSGEGKRFFKKYGPWGLSCVNMAFKKTVWKEAKFEGVSYCEDRIFQKRAFEKGYISTFSKNAAVLHAHSYKTIRKLFERIVNEGLGWKQLGENYSVIMLFKDLLRFDMHWLAIKSIFKNKLKYPSEVIFFIIRPFALYWGNHFAKSVY